MRARTLTLLIALLAAALIPAALGARPVQDLPGLLAVWELAPGQVVTPSTTRLDVLVTQVDCNNGRTNTPLEPEITLTEDRVVIAVTVADEDRGRPVVHTCQSNPPVPLEVVLPEPLGHRALVDGTCASYDPDAEEQCLRVPAP